MGSRAFGGATTRYARIRLIATIPWMRERTRNGEPAKLSVKEMSVNALEQGWG